MSASTSIVLGSPFQLQSKSTKSLSRRADALHRSSRRRRHVNCSSGCCPVHPGSPGCLDALPWASSLDEPSTTSPLSSDFADLSQIDHAPSQRLSGPVRTRKLSAHKRVNPLRLSLDASSSSSFGASDAHVSPPTTPVRPHTAVDFLGFRNLMPVLACDASRDVSGILSPRVLR